MSEPAPARHTLRNALLALLAVLLLSLGLWATVPPDTQPTGATPARPAASALPVVAGLGGDFRLPATTGGELALADLRGKVVLLNFGFTSCPDVCPMTLTRIGNAMRALEREGIEATRVQPLFVTFDPQRDTLDQLRAYVAFFHPSLVGLRGDAEQTRELAARYKVLYLQQDSGSASGYVFQHTDYVYVIDTLGRVRLLVAGKDPEEALVESVKTLLREAKSP